MSIRTKNILTALLAVVLLGGFIFLAEGRKKDNDRLDAIDQVTTTTAERTTTTRRPTTTTTATTLLSTTTSAVVPATTRPTTATTLRRTTTTRRPTTATTRRPSATTPPPASPAPPFNGTGTETSDNTGSFFRNGEGSYTGAGAAACPSSDPFCFYLSSSEANGALRFTATLRNNTNRTITFPGGLKIVVTVNRPTGTQSQFIMDASSVTTLPSKEGLAISSSTTFPDNGQYTFTASCEVNYGS